MIVRVVILHGPGEAVRNTGLIQVWLSSRNVLNDCRYKIKRISIYIVVIMRVRLCVAGVSGFGIRHASSSGDRNQEGEDKNLQHFKKYFF